MAGSVAPGLPLLALLLVLAAAEPPPAGEVWQSPLYAVAPAGGSTSIACSVHTNGTLLGVHLRQGRLPKALGVAYYDGAGATTVDGRFQGRVLLSGPAGRLAIALQRLRPEDSGAYFCEAIMEEGNGWGAGTTLVVTAASACPGTQLAHFAFSVALALGCLLLLLGLAAMCVLRRRQVGSVCLARDKSATCVVYEDMSCSRRNTLSTPHHNQ